jgi:transcriptional regulator with XRE-family HTH domain
MRFLFPHVNRKRHACNYTRHQACCKTAYEPYVCKTAAMMQGGDVTPIAAELKRLRGSMSQRAFAQAAGVKLSTYQSYEAGTRNPPEAVIDKIGKGHALDTEQLAALRDARARTAELLGGPPPRPDVISERLEAIHEAVNGLTLVPQLIEAAPLDTVLELARQVQDGALTLRELADSVAQLHAAVAHLHGAVQQLQAESRQSKPGSSPGAS